MLVLLAACAEHPVAIDHEPNWICSCAPAATTGSTEEALPQLAAARTDVLVVVDPERAGEVTAALPLLAEALDETGTDWQLALVSTAIGDLEVAGLPVGGWISAGDPLPDALVLPAAPPLAALAAGSYALTDAGLRADAVVQVLFVVAADDLTSDSEAFEATLADVRPAGRDRSVAVVAPANASVLRSLPDGDEPVGVELEDVLPEAAFVAAGLARTFPLSLRPALDTLYVHVADPSGADLTFTLDEDYTFDDERNAVRFLAYWPDPGAIVEVSYLVEVGPEGDG